jgi:CHRD domain
MKSTIHAALTVVLLLGSGLALASDSKVTLTGKDEVPAVETAATGSGTITVGADKSVSGSVTTKGMDGIAAHIHQAAVGKNGPPIISLEKAGDGKWSVPKDSKLTDEQLAAYKAGELYVNVHSAAHKGGEIRAQLKP